MVTLFCHIFLRFSINFCCYKTRNDNIAKSIPELVIFDLPKLIISDRGVEMSESLSDFTSDQVLQIIQKLNSV